ncbi:unnamed protein product [Parascedosporium putredinis]|uniref:F-box domain-containing protein n=1 Tax=Parascedosporium putredinis TaxID=1442378 RepID=A0A9P1MDN1_9PEZI|nr:unnamed protein product [Parascedosporium putredinis]CAI7998878.1 unnamed protein product [Parascedosporium putredinis]
MADRVVELEMTVAPTPSSSSLPGTSAQEYGLHEPTSRDGRELDFLGLPLETQHTIFRYCSKADLVTLCVVSKRFHELAAAELYRFFAAKLGDTNILYRGSRFALSGILDTLTTSEYNYAQFLRHFTIDSQYLGDKARPACQPFSYSTSSGRFLNTLLHLTLREAQGLESFNTTNDPPTLSAFKNLRRLTILDIETLDLLPDIRAAIEASEATLTHLGLSFSSTLAKKARETNPDPDSDASDLDDEFHNGSSFDANGPVRPARAQKEWDVQETTLARLFGLRKCTTAQSSSKKGKKKKRNSDSTTSDILGEDESDQDPDAENDNSPSTKNNRELEKLIDALKLASGKVLNSATEARYLSGQHDDILDIIGKAVGKFVEEDSRKKSQDGVEAAGSSSAAQNDGVTGRGESAPRKPSSISGLDDIDIADSGDVESLCDADDEKDEDVEASGRAVAAEPGSAGNAGTAGNAAHTSLFTGPAAAPAHGRNKASSPCGATDRASLVGEHLEEQKLNLISSYVKSTRGLGLRSFSLHLVPLKTSVIGQALDLHMLRSLTLLNVGNQAPLWTLLSKENKTKPLALREVFTDHVTAPFVSCMAELEELHALFMIERSSKYRPATFVHSSKVLLRAIRKQILEKHLPTLKRLMIRNDNRPFWDLDHTTVVTVCGLGANLEEFSASLRIQNVLEFIAIEDRVTVIIRAPVKRPEMGAEARAGGKQDIKGKAKAVNYDSSSDSGWSTSSTSFSESSYESAANAKMEALLRNDVPIRLKTRNVTIESVHGVKIFEKEVRAGEL